MLVLSKQDECQQRDWSKSVTQTQAAPGINTVDQETDTDADSSSSPLFRNFGFQAHWYPVISACHLEFASRGTYQITFFNF
jgi:hypothetical protein